MRRPTSGELGAARPLSAETGRGGGVSEQRALRLQLGICGNSAELGECFRLACRFARSEAPVLLRGETGVGKELFARAIHYMSPRRPRPFVPVNCGAIPETLFESELFGAAKGAYTGAALDREGLVEIAHGGTLFLDEVDSLPARAQVALLRFLQEREYRRVGSGALRRSDVRMVAATNASIEDCVEAAQFRLDLLFRLDVCSLQIPSLTERRSDVAPLVAHFLERFAALYRRPVPAVAPEALAWLASRDWPGNLRQLENVIHRAIVALTGDVIDLALLCRVWPTAKRGCAARPDADALAEGPLIAARKRAAFAFEHRYLHQLMEAVGGNVSEAARRAGTERRAMGRLLKRHGISRLRG